MTTTYASFLLNMQQKPINPAKQVPVVMNTGFAFSDERMDERMDERTDERTDIVDIDPVMLVNISNRSVVKHKNKKIDKVSMVPITKLNVVDEESVVPESVVPESVVPESVVPESDPLPAPKISKIRRRGVSRINQPDATDKDDSYTVIPQPTTTKPPPKRKPKLRIVDPKSDHLKQYMADTDHLITRMPKQDNTTNLKTDKYYLTNRENYITFINNLYEPYKKKLEDANATNGQELTCDTMNDDSTDFSLLMHQKIVKEYINTYTPYRGVLLYHGLGTGKTCSSIAIAEGLKSTKPVIVMTPASLKKNYIEELKTCGDQLYRKNQFWEFVSVTDSSADSALISQMSQLLGLPEDYIRRHGGAWFVNVSKPPNHTDLTDDEKSRLDVQIEEMIRSKYTFISYNGLRQNNLASMTKNQTINPFDNSVVVIDEAHNFVSRIVNKLGKNSNSNNQPHLSVALYEYLMTATNVRIILLTGTPMINYPNELGVMFNILRGKIDTWSFRIDATNLMGKLDQNELSRILREVTELDFMEYTPSTRTMKVTRNPYGFENKGIKGAATSKPKYYGVKRHSGTIGSDTSFVNTIISTLGKANILVRPTDISVESYKSLPDTFDDFQTMFVNPKTYEIQNTELLKRRIMGLTSYFRSVREELMPRYERGKDFHIVRCEMSDFQFTAYEEARVKERKLDTNNAKKKKEAGDNIFVDTVSTYRIFSRAFCNFTFPSPEIKRPYPNNMLDASVEDETTGANTQITEGMVDAVSIDAQLNDPSNALVADDEEALRSSNNEVVDDDYSERIDAAIDELDRRGDEFLTSTALSTYSTKFLAMLERISDDANKGLHLMYSQFRTLEGIGIMSLVLKHNGFAEFKLIKNSSGHWDIDITRGDEDKPMYALYTGTESAEEKEIIRNVFNSQWDDLPEELNRKLMDRSSGGTNRYGEIIKVLMISASGAEGISLKNVRYVHITEPYWHPVRTEQVIGRARRICSHSELPEEEQTVEVFCYLSVLTDEQIKSDRASDLRKKDLSKLNGTSVVTTDELLFEISSIKERVSNELLKNVKESAFDCALHANSNRKEGLRCLSFGKVSSTASFSAKPNILTDDKDSTLRMNRRRTEVDAEAQMDSNTNVWYAVNKKANRDKSHDAYDLESYKVGQLEYKGRMMRSAKQNIRGQIMWVLVRDTE